VKNPYEDIIGLPCPTSERHPRMSMANRAAQFSPFAALTGYDDAVRDTARHTDGRVELTEEEKAVLDAKLRTLAERTAGQPSAAFVCFEPDGKKQGGVYLTVKGTVKKIDRYAGAVVLTDGRRIPIEDVLDIQTGEI